MAKGATTNREARSPELKEAWQRYEAGDVVMARRAATRALGGADESEARELIRRTRVPHDAYRYVAGAAALVLGMLLFAILRG